MQFPYKVRTLTRPEATVWAEYYAGASDRDRTVEEGIWRRTQAPENADQSGWHAGDSSRRRIVHYRYKFDVVADSLFMTQFYLYFCNTYPRSEIDRQEAILLSELETNGWVRTQDFFLKGDLECRITRFEEHPEDRAASRITAAEYESLEVVFTSRNHCPGREVTYLPWHVLNGGMRVKDLPGQPTRIQDLSELSKYLPFQVEVGCGTSVEAGIPPLHRLHEIYRVTDRHDNKPGAKDPFILNADSDELLTEIVCRTERKFEEFTEMICTCLHAEPTEALKALRRMRQAGHVVGPVITNNFDVLCARAGMDECFVRRYDQKVPDIELHEEAKALLVVGNHADRRKVEARARERGMVIFFLDPEGFWLDGSFAPYPLEGPQDSDFVCGLSAGEGLLSLEKMLIESSKYRPSEETGRAPYGNSVFASRSNSSDL